jgi:putative nucleotidyltransferase with HDIG domain
VSSKPAIQARIREFPALPALCQRILSKANDPDLDLGHLEEEIRYDPGMTANLLKMANSAFFGMARKVESLQSAIAVLGLKRLFDLVVARSVASTLGERLPGYNLAPEELLKHSVWVAVASEKLARTLNLAPPDMLFTAGLLHDIGKIVMDGFVQKSWKRINVVMKHNEMFDRVEQRVLGLSHAEVGAELLEHWNFPAELVFALRWHHQPGSAAEHVMLAEMVHIADMLAYTEGIGTGVDGLRYTISQSAIAHLGLRTRNLEAVASHTLDTMNELEKLLAGSK